LPNDDVRVVQLRRASTYGRAAKHASNRRTPTIAESPIRL
jgi:hypothetical protein